MAKNITGLSKKETWENRQNMQMVFQDPLASFDPKMKIRGHPHRASDELQKIKRSEKKREEFNEDTTPQSFQALTEASDVESAKERIFAE